jgi:hypothetical protein
MKDQFDYLYWEGEKAHRNFAFNCHPFVSRRPVPDKNHRRVYRYAKGFSDVWFARRVEIANWCLRKDIRSAQRDAVEDFHSKRHGEARSDT